MQSFSALKMIESQIFGEFMDEYVIIYTCLEEKWEKWEKVKESTGNILGIFHGSASNFWICEIWGNFVLLSQDSQTFL